MKRTRLKRIGKTGKVNIEARQRIAEIAEAKGLNYCELQLSGCWRNMYLAPAHKHKRAWYRGDVEKLSDYREWVSCCVSCHNAIEHNRDLTEGIFNKLRP